MKKIFFAVAAFVLTTLTITFLQGCMKDKCSSTFTYTMYRPVYKTTAEVRANIKSNAPRKIEQPGKLFILGQYIFLNELDKGIHIINNVNPSQPQNVAFIDIPGNLDIAVKGNTLYADLYTDLVTLNISNPLQVSVTKIVEGVFPHRFYGGYFMNDSSRVITEWIKKDTTVTEDCNATSNWWEKDSGVFMRFSAQNSFASAGNAGSASSASPVGVGGSMARFTLVNQYLYTVGNRDLDVFDISSPTNPLHVNNKNIGWNIETIYPFNNRLFIGSNSGMFIYDLTNASNPNLLGQFSHVRSCDPVIADNDHAYVTLRSGTECQGFTNQLEVLDISNLTQPSLLKTYQMTNPHGLSKDGNLLFICDGKDGLKVYNAANVNNMQLLRTVGGMETYDVIAFNGNAIVVAKDGLYQFSYTSSGVMTQLSKLSIN